MIEIDQVTAGYGHNPVLHAVSLTIAEGECLALLGPSGTGKTTLLRLIAGFERPSAGSIRIHGRTVSRKRKCLAPHKRQLSMVFQDLALWPHMTVWQHLEFASAPVLPERRDRNPRIETILELVRLKRYRRTYPHQLSGGERQRLALARALVMSPKALLLDEPLSGLDFGLRKTLLTEIRSIIEELSVTTLYVTHELKEAALVADRIVVIRHGGIYGIFAPDQLDAVAQALWTAGRDASQQEITSRKIIPLDDNRFLDPKSNRKEATHGNKRHG